MMSLYLKWHKLVKSVCYGLVGVLCNVLNTLLCQVWNVADGRELAVCSKHDGWVSSCWFSSDSDFLVSVSNNIKVRLYIYFFWNIYSFVTYNKKTLSTTSFVPFYFRSSRFLNFADPTISEPGTGYNRPDRTQFQSCGGGGEGGG